MRGVYTEARVCFDFLRHPIKKLKDYVCLIFLFA